MLPRDRPLMGPNPGPKMQQNPGAGIGGRPIGRGTRGREQKMDNPTNVFRNTQNTERVLNVERVSNAKFVLNVETGFKFKSSDDILELLRSHPDFERLPADHLQPIAAAVLAGLLAGGGLLLLVLAPGASGSVLALSIKVAGGAMVSAGMAGVENALKHGVAGTFTWSHWLGDMALSGSTVVLTMGSAAIASWGTTAVMMLRAEQFTLDSLAYIARCAQAASTVVGGLASTAGEALKKVVKDEKIDPTMLLACLVTGGLQGYKIGADVSNLAMEAKLKELAKTPEDLCNFYKEFWTSEKNFYQHVNKHANEFISDKTAIIAEFDKAKAESVTILSQDTIDALEKLAACERGAVYGEAAAKVVGNPYNAVFMTKDLSRVNWNRLWYDGRVVIVTSIHATDPIANPEKMVTAYRMNLDKYFKKLWKIHKDVVLGKIGTPHILYPPN